jgi:nitrate/nitrite transport system ATP-binding protein
MALLELKNVSKSFGNNHVLENINLSVEKEDFICIVGFSGSGKSTLIKLITGLLQPDNGTITLEGKPIVGTTPKIGLVFQNYSLLPWLSVIQNVNLGVKQIFKKLTTKKQTEISESYLGKVNLSHALGKKPSELSGGMRQRVSVARTLAMSPEIMLLDEPLSALDALTRSEIQKEFEKIWKEEKKTIIMITNDVDEALLLANKIIPITKGPKATLGPIFTVDLKRPRNLDELNKDENYRHLKSDITKYLYSLQDSIKIENSYQLPEAKPKQFSTI